MLVSGSVTIESSSTVLRSWTARTGSLGGGFGNAFFDFAIGDRADVVDVF